MLRHRAVQLGVAVIVSAALWLAWWTVSPFFIRPVLVESTRESTVALGTASPSPEPAGTMAPSVPDTSATAAPPGDPTPKVFARGQLKRIDALHAGSGGVILFELDDRWYLRFEDVSILNGPDLQVYLGVAGGAVHEPERDLHLGALRAPEGTFTYELPSGTDLSAFKSVVVWCRVFRVVFTYADLAMP